MEVWIYNAKVAVLLRDVCSLLRNSSVVGRCCSIASDEKCQFMVNKQSFPLRNYWLLRQVNKNIWVKIMKRSSLKCAEV